MAKVLVTGAAGFIGSNTVDTLLAAGHEVVGVDNFRTGKEENLRRASSSPQFRFYRADVTTPQFASVVQSEQPAALLHLAALVSVPESIANPQLNDLLNVQATRLVIEAARSSGSVRRIAFASSAAVYGNNSDLPIAESARLAPLSPYGAAKLQSERLLAAATASHPDLSTVALRYFNVFGPRQDPRSPYSGVISIFAAALREKRTVTLHGDGEQTRDFISVADVARANLAALTKPIQGSLVANVCTGRATSLNALLKAMSQTGGLDFPITTYGPPREGDIKHSLGLGERAKTHLGFTAEDSLETGLRALFTS